MTTRPTSSSDDPSAGPPDVTDATDGSDTVDAAIFDYRGWRFRCAARPASRGNFEPVVTVLAGEGEQPGKNLPNDTTEMVYGTAAEALRHAEQQAMRWVHDRTGTGLGQF